ncbi:hypothetical protein OEZ86_002001 [Tetradesmus obliquus]|nr:hypothetical protein OEZ86_002001 [Tetradesmus obliquus]
MAILNLVTGKPDILPAGFWAAAAAQWLCCGCLDLADYEALADAVERNLMRGRAIIMAFGWRMLMMDNEQTARLCVASWPYWPLMRALVGHKLGKL